MIEKHNTLININDNTARNTGRARRKHRGRRKQEHDSATQDRQGTGTPVEAVRVGGSKCADGVGKQREVGTPGQEIPGDEREMIEQVKDGKGGANRRGKADTGLCEELLGMPVRGGKCRRAVEAGRKELRPGGRGRSGCKDREKRCRRFKDRCDKG